MAKYWSSLSFAVGIAVAVLLAALVPPIFQQHNKTSEHAMAALRSIRLAPSLSSQSLFNSIRSSFISTSKHSYPIATRPFSTSSTNMSAKSYLDTVKGRRSVYALEKKSPISDARLEEIVKDTVLHTPSAFNSQTTRVVVLLKDDHDKFWEFVKAAIKAIVPAEQFANSETRLNGFKAGYGTASFCITYLQVASLIA